MSLSVSAATEFLLSLNFVDHFNIQTLNKIPKFRRKPPETCRSKTLYLDWTEDDGTVHEPYYQPVATRHGTPISVDTVSLQTVISTSSSYDDFLTDFNRPQTTVPRPRVRPQTLLLKALSCQLLLNHF